MIKLKTLLIQTRDKPKLNQSLMRRVYSYSIFCQMGCGLKKPQAELEVFEE